MQQYDAIIAGQLSSVHPSYMNLVQPDCLF